MTIAAAFGNTNVKLQPDLPYSFQKHLGGKLGAEIDEGCTQHVTGDSADGFEVKHLAHERSSLMRMAIMAAPKPLSILTTDTPVAHAFSIPRRAARPWKLAP